MDINSQSLKKNPNILKRTVHMSLIPIIGFYGMSQVIGHESHWKARKFQEAHEIYRGEVTW
jgi:hypothetical protein